MKKKTVKGMNGKTVTILEPENAKDAKKLREMKDIDRRVSFGDMRGEKK